MQFFSLGCSSSKRVKLLAAGRSSNQYPSTNSSSQYTLIVINLTNTNHFGFMSYFTNHTRVYRLEKFQVDRFPTRMSSQWTDIEAILKTRSSYISSSNFIQVSRPHVNTTKDLLKIKYCLEEVDTTSKVHLTITSYLKQAYMYSKKIFMVPKMSKRTSQKGNQGLQHLFH